MNGETTGGTDWTQFVMGVNDAALQWYSTVTQKPIAREAPSSLMGFLTGTDYGRTGPTSTYSSPIGGGIIVIGVLVVLGIALSRR